MYIHLYVHSYHFYNHLKPDTVLSTKPPIVTFWSILLWAGSPRHKVLFYRAKVLRRENAKYRFANNSVELTTTFHECAISGISLTPCLFTCLISLFALSLMHIKQFPVAKSEGFQAKGKEKSLTSNLLRNGIQQSTVGERQTLCGRVLKLCERKNGFTPKGR